MSGVSKEIALSEVNAWLDYKKVNAKKREEFKNNIESMTEAIMDGTFVMNEDKSIIHRLSFPVGKDEFQTKELVYKPRLSAQDNRTNCKGEFATGDGRFIGIVAGLTGKPKNLIEALDTEDFGMAACVALFFLT